DPRARVPPFQLPEPVITPGGDAQRKEENVTGEVAKLHSHHGDADGDNLPDGQRGGANTECAHEPPAITGDGLGCALGAGERGAEPSTPAAIDKAEHQEGLDKPEWPWVEFPLVPEPDEGRPESLALCGRDHRPCERPENQAEGKQGQSEPAQHVSYGSDVSILDSVPVAARSDDEGRSRGFRGS